MILIFKNAREKQQQSVEREGCYRKCGIIYLFFTVFLRLMDGAAASSVWPAAVYYSSDLICLTDDQTTLKSPLSAGGEPGRAGRSGQLQAAGWMLMDARWERELTSFFLLSQKRTRPQSPPRTNSLVLTSL